jgi:hypothetical protein
MTDTESRLLTRRSLLLALVVFVGVAGSGLARRWLGVAGYDTLGTVVFVLGYGGTAVLVWYVWIRPLNITGPVDG